MAPIVAALERSARVADRFCEARIATSVKPSENSSSSAPVNLVHATRSSLRMFNLAIQLNPDEQGLVASAEQVRDYLKTYFDSSHFTVEWGSPHTFVERLWEEWDQWRR